MKPRSHIRRRGQPLIALVLVMVSWVGARAALWDGTAGIVVESGKPAATQSKPLPAQKAQPVLPPLASAASLLRCESVSSVNAADSLVFSF